MIQESDTTILLPHTPVKRQGKTASCWGFSVLSYLETECPGKEYAPWYLVRGKYQDLILQAEKYQLKKMPSGGLGHTAINLLLENGILCLADYPGGIPDNKGFRVLNKLTFTLYKLTKAHPCLKSLAFRIVQKSMDLLWGKLPQDKTAKLEITLREKLENMVELTSFLHLPYEEWSVLDLPDNYERKPFYNVPMETFIGLLKDLLYKGRSFVWDGCLKGGYSMQKGTAILAEDAVVSDAHRCEQFLNGTLTDDHMMHIIGLTRKEGKLYFIAKNSVGEVGPYKGLLYMDEDFFRMKTVSVLVDSRDIGINIKKYCQ